MPCIQCNRYDELDRSDIWVIGQIQNGTLNLSMDDSSGYGNKLEYLHPSVGNMTYLTTLDIGSQRLSNLPDSLYRLSNLEHLVLWGNRLSTLKSIVLYYNDSTFKLPQSFKNIVLGRSSYNVYSTVQDIPEEYFLSDMD